MGPLRIYIDSKFSDLVDKHLISIGCVDDVGNEYYAEIDNYPAAACSDFVRTVVLPHLGKEPSMVMSRERLRETLLAWLEEVRAGDDLMVSYDYFGDFALLVEALGEIPGWLRPDNVRDRVNEQIREAFFGIAVDKRHHALWDARALRRAYCADLLSGA